MVMLIIKKSLLGVSFGWSNCLKFDRSSVPDTLKKLETGRVVVLQQLTEVYLGSCRTSPIRVIHKVHTQPVFTCSKLTIETLEQGVKYVQS